MPLRWYQQAAVDAVWDHFRKHTSNPIVVAPTGAGKSHIIGAFVATATPRFPATRFIVAMHHQQLVEQTAQ